MKKFIYTLVMVLTLSILSLPNNTLALSCAEPPEPLEAFEKSDTVLIGTVLEIKESSVVFKDHQKSILLEIKDVFKGTEVKELEIRENLTWGTSEVGKTYLYYLSKEGSHLVNPLCSATTSNLEEANAFTDIFPSIGVDSIVEEEVIEEPKENGEVAIKEPAKEEVSDTNTDYILGFVAGFTVTLFVLIILIVSIRKKGTKK